MCRILDLAATRARQIAPEQRFEHQHQRIPLTALDLLLQHIRSGGPHLGDWDWHVENTERELSFAFYHGSSHTVNTTPMPPPSPPPTPAPLRTPVHHPTTAP